ncbi:MAG TPA: hypothetical protein VFX23_02220 [Limnobacter sp.]|uniref:CAF17-like 4Fe-4S cluster assembly/insertion protein YgfZ n=1 Tax=Limnobacter sp. TaxID=2003368 RepID=UPI002E378ADB|nr:hypothetical protein [Limnobacter sp.]HEX5484790.1 hypothetical protein [Limnobacter sp.]
MNIATVNLTHMGLVRVTGADSTAFLQAQMTQAIASLSPNKVTLAGYCTAKGRQLASFIVIRHEDAYLMLTHRGLIEPLIKRLRMFVLRSKVVLENVSNQYQINFLQARPGDAMTKSVLDDGSLHISLRPLPGQSDPCALQLNPQAESPDADSADGHGTPADNAFSVALIKLGIPMVTPSTWEEFVPQQINFDLIGGVSFDKGCYPGQEVVARSHYLGKSKKRSVIGLIDVDAPVAEKSDIWLEGKDNEPIGKVVNAAMDGGQCLVLFECPVDIALQSESKLSVDSNGQKIPLQRIQLPPYDIQAKGNQYA